MIVGSSHEEQSDISITMDNIDKSAREKLLPRFHVSALKRKGCSMILPQGIRQDHW